MDRRTRTQVLVEAGPLFAVELAALVERESQVDVTQPPHQGLAMCQVRETARNSRFYLGEALMTECRVRVGDAEGLGVLLGANDAHARAMAIVDAAFNAPVRPSCLDELERRLQAELERQAQERREAQARIQTSRVNFDEMSGQDMSVQAVVS